MPDLPAERFPPTPLKGYCPMGCGETLFVAAGGYIICSRIACPAPTAASEILHDAETEHTVLFGEGTFIVRHPLRERMDDALMRCHLHEHIAGLSGPPMAPGWYRAVPLGGSARWIWIRLGSPEHPDISEATR
jgi:hypothetical protein